MDELKRCEELKREAAQNPLARWKAVQNFLTWAASQSTAAPMTPAARKAKERRLLAGLAEMSEKRPTEHR